MVSDESLKHLKEEKWSPNRDFSIAVWVSHARTATEGPFGGQQVHAAVPLALWCSLWQVRAFLGGFCKSGMLGTSLLGVNLKTICP